MTAPLTITVSNPRLEAALQALFIAGQYSFTVKETPDNTSQWDDLTAEDYRQMIRMQTPTIKAKSFADYEG